METFRTAALPNPSLDLSSEQYAFHFLSKEKLIIDLDCLSQNRANCRHLRLAMQSRAIMADSAFL